MFKKIFVTSDLHLSDTIWKHRPIYGDSYHSWRYIVDYAVWDKADAVILAGDILDKQLNVARPVAELNAGIKKLRDNGISVLYNQGQHEFQRDLPWMEVASLDALHLTLDSNDRLANGMRIVGFDYCNAKTLAENLAAIAKDSTQEYVLVCHQVWKDFMGEVGKTQGCFDDIPPNVKLLVTGDYHQTIERKHGSNLTVLSPGSTHLRSLAEPASKYFFKLTCDDVDFKICTQEIPTRGYLEVSTNAGSYKKIVERVKDFLSLNQQSFTNLPEELRKPIIRLVHGTEDFDFVRFVKQEFDDKAHLFFKHKSVVVEALSSDVTVDESKLTLQSCLSDEIEPEGAPMAYALASELLSGGNPDVVLERWLEDNTNAD
jgi:DNA repair exonuclease SbcCD nuclease subunit